MVPEQAEDPDKSKKEGSGAGGAKGKSKRRGKALRTSIEENLEREEKIRQLKHFRTRVETARKGMASSEAGKFPEAAGLFQQYLKMLEDLKTVAPGGLRPHHFDKKADMLELLLISGVYWDLAKIYDRVKSRGQLANVRKHLNLYVTFSKGMPYQPVCAETLRKYIVSGKAKHTSEMNAAYKRLAVTKCYLATALIDVTDGQTLPRLTRFRDLVLMQSVLGRFTIRVYYAVSPFLSRVTDALPHRLRKWLGRKIDRIATLADTFFLSKNRSRSLGSEGKVVSVEVKPGREPN